MPFTYVVNVYSDMSLSKGHLGSRGGGEASKNKLKDTSFIFPMTNATILGVFRITYWSLFCHAIHSVFSSFAVISVRKRELVCFTLIVFLLPCGR